MQKALVLGGYGLIGSACMRALGRAGFAVTGMGRSTAAARASDPAADWIIRDIPTVTPDEWRKVLTGTDVVVNASGALQDGGRDDLQAIHMTAIDHLVTAAQGLPVKIIQISAAGVSQDAATAFFRTKAAGDALIATRAADWVILRPVLVLSPEAYGGTALLRAAAALPGVLPVVFHDAPVQTVHVDDVAAAVVLAAQGGVPSGTTADLCEVSSRTFPELVAHIRLWLGLPTARFRPPVPVILLRTASGIADLLGHLGWRAPLRSTALAALSGGITGNPAAWVGPACRSLDETLAALPATRQERLFARTYLILPLAIATLALFWTLSGIIGLARFDAAREVLLQGAPAHPAATLAVAGGGLADLCLGLAILWRRWSRPAALGMVVLSLAYLAGGAVFAPWLWLDPLGPMVKVLPGITLAAMVWVLLEDR